MLCRVLNSFSEDSNHHFSAGQCHYCCHANVDYFCSFSSTIAAVVVSRNTIELRSFEMPSMSDLELGVSCLDLNMCTVAACCDHESLISAAAFPAH